MPNVKYSTINKARKKGNKGTTSRKTVIKVSANFIEVLIGGYYPGHVLGHSALRVVTTNKDYVYDFGRYREVGGVFNEKGEGVLNVWKNFNSYIEAENNLGRKTIGYVYYLKEDEINSIVEYFNGILKKRLRYIEYKNRIQYILQKEYNLFNHNCATVTVDGIKQSGKNIISSEFFNIGGGFFSPKILYDILEENTEVKYDKKNIYKK